MIADHLFDHIELEHDTVELFLEIAEAYRSAPRDGREFYLSRALGLGGTRISQSGTRWQRIIQDYDLDLLQQHDLVHVRRPGTRTDWVNVTPFGLRYYEYLRRRQAQPVSQVEDSVTGFLDGVEFARRYPSAHAKWSEAVRLLWSAGADRELSRIGHTCREAMQEFATEVVDRTRPSEAPHETHKTVARLRASLSQTKIGSTERPFLEAIIAYWGTVTDLVQRQEHAGQKEGEPIGWEDARRIVFHTMIVMYEISRVM